MQKKKLPTTLQKRRKSPIDTGYQIVHLLWITMDSGVM